MPKLVVASVKLLSAANVARIVAVPGDTSESV